MSAAGDATVFLAAGYGLTWLALFVYTWRVERRLDDARRTMDALSDEEETTRSHGRRGDRS